MKRLPAILGITLVLAACSESIERPDVPVLKIQPASARDSLEKLSRKNGCSDCHAFDVKVTGPAWRDIARRYNGVTSFEYASTKYSLEDGLVRKASLGGWHNWGEEYMKRNDPGSLSRQGKRQKDIREMIRLILRLPCECQPVK